MTAAPHISGGRAEPTMGPADAAFVSGLTAYLLPVVARGFLLPPAMAGGASEPGVLVWLPPAMTAIGCIVLFFFAGDILSFLAPIVEN